MTAFLRLTKNQKDARRAGKCVIGCGLLADKYRARFREGLKESLRNLLDEKVDLKSIF